MRLLAPILLLLQLALGTAFALDPRLYSPSTKTIQGKTSVPRTDPFWLEQIKHQGVAAFNSNTTYQVFRNVKDFGAKGDGIHDDTAAINLAISSGNRCGTGCSSSTTTAAVVYFPSGTYLISSSIIDYWETQLIGNPNNLPVIKGTANFVGNGLIDGDLNDQVSAEVEFYRQIRNFVLDTTGIPANASAIGLHWPTSQATSLQNIVFKLSDSNGTAHIGLLSESGSAGFMTDLIFHGGRIGAVFGNEQFTMRNLTFSNAVIAIEQTFDWTWTYKSITINNCSTGISMTAAVGSLTLIDSFISNTLIGISNFFNPASLTTSASGALILENVQIANVGTTIQDVVTTVQGSTSSAVLAGTTGSRTIAAWGQGHGYTPSGPQILEEVITPNSRPASLLSGGKFYERSKPQYASIPISQFSSVRSAGAKGDGVTDDTVALQRAIIAAASANKILFVDAGTYKVSKTIRVPANSKIVGESYSVILSSGVFFSDMSKPQPVVQVGLPGETGYVELSDLIVSTQGAQAGAVLIEWNLATTGATPSGMWDVHTRIGGFAGSQLQAAQCPATPANTTINHACIGAFMSMHITKTATGVYLENNWFWLADHDLDNVLPDAQITVYAGRGILVESTLGNIWMYGTAAEHHVLYQYQLVNTKNVYLGCIQTETPYYQPNPNATLPFPPVTSLNDPNFKVSCAGKGANCATAWAVRVVSSKDVLFYGAGLYSFFSNYSVGVCSAAKNCQSSVVSLEGSLSNVGFYNLATVGSSSMVDVNGVGIVNATINNSAFASTIGLFRES